MPSISQLVSDKESAKVKVRGLSVEVEYNPNKITMRKMAELTRRANADDVEAIADMIPEILDSWDLEGPLQDDEGNELVGAGEVIPVEPDLLVELPAMFLVEFSQKMQELAMSGANPTKATRPSRKR